MYIRTVYLSDPLRSRALVVNYDEATENYIFLRCGESDELRPNRRVQELRLTGPAYFTTLRDNQG